MNYHNRNYINHLRRTAHSPENSSDEWAFFFLYIRFTSAVTQTAIKSVVKIIIFHLSQSKCTVFAHQRESRVFPCIVCILCIVSDFSCPRDTPFKKGRRTMLCAAALKIVLL